MKHFRWTGIAVIALTLGAGITIAPTAATSQEITKQHIYSETADPRVEIAQALKTAKKEHKRVLLTFGGDWCPDCQMLNLYLHDSENASLVAKDYVVVHVWIGHVDHNLELAQQYGVPISKGVPAVSVLDANGKVVHAQNAGEFSNMRRMPSASVTEFLNRWKA